MLEQRHYKLKNHPYHMRRHRSCWASALWEQIASCLSCRSSLLRRNRATCFNCCQYGNTCSTTWPNQMQNTSKVKKKWEKKFAVLFGPFIAKLYPHELAEGLDWYEHGTNHFVERTACWQFLCRCRCWC